MACVNLMISWTTAILHLFSQETDLLMKVIMKCVNIKLWDILGCFHYILNAPHSMFMNYTFQRANDKDTDQTERMRSLVCAFHVRMQQRQVFLRHCPYFTAGNSIECVFGCFCYISNNVWRKQKWPCMTQTHLNIIRVLRTSYLAKALRKHHKHCSNGNILDLVGRMPQR